MHLIINGLQRRFCLSRVAQVGICMAVGEPQMTLFSRKLADSLGLQGKPEREVFIMVNN
jgi:hypothetical protein